MNTQALNSRLTSLFDAHNQTSHLISRLSKLPSQPGSSSPNPDAGDARLELSAEIHQSLKEQDEELELLRQEVEDQTNSVNWISAARRGDIEKEKNRTNLAAQVAHLGEDLKIARIQFRKAQLQAKRNAEAAKRKERELLFADVQEGSNTAGTGRRRGQEKLSQDELTLNASSDVTAALRRTHDLMQSELSRSQFAHETLGKYISKKTVDPRLADVYLLVQEQSTAALSTLSESYSNLDTLLSSSRSLVSSLLHSQKSDTWYLESAFWILVTTIAWLVFRRIIYGPGWWLLYLPTKLLVRLSISFLGTLATLAGAIGGPSQSTALSQASESISTSLIVQPSATGGIPRFATNMPVAPMIIGSGGRGGAAGRQQPGQPPPNEGKSVSEKVGKMAEESQQGDQERDERPQANEGGTTLRERRSDEPPNPKKRMWEENLQDQEPEREERQGDEL